MVTINLFKIEESNQELERFNEAIKTAIRKKEAYFEISYQNGLDRDSYKNLKDEVDYLLYIERHLKKYLRNLRRSKHSYEAEYDAIIKYTRELLLKLSNVAIEIYDLFSELEKECVTLTTTAFVRNESSLLHLVSTNNHAKKHIRKYSDDAFMYECQFHNERTPSMRVDNSRNSLFCYGCGASLNVINYLATYEGITIHDAIELLAAINKLDIGTNPFAEHEIVKKYNSPYNLARFQKRVNEGLIIAKRSPKSLHNYIATLKYMQELDTITRIKNNEYKENLQKVKKVLIKER